MTAAISNGISQTPANPQNQQLSSDPAYLPERAFYEFSRNAAFHEMLQSGYFRFVENAFVINYPQYIRYLAGEFANLYGNPPNLSVEELREKILAHDILFWKLEDVRKWGEGASPSGCHEEMVEKVWFS